MSDREIMNAKQGIPMWWKPGIAFLKEDWVNHKDLKQFYYKKSTERNCSWLRRRRVQGSPAVLARRRAPCGAPPRDATSTTKPALPAVGPPGPQWSAEVEAG